MWKDWQDWLPKPGADTWKGFVGLATIFWSLVLIIFMLGIGAGDKLSCTTPEGCQQLYLNAVADTIDFKPDKATSMPPLPSAKDITVVTWAGVSYTNLLQKLKREPIWVSLVPEVQEKCRKYRYKDPEKLNMRLKQLFGLPPTSTKTHFIEIRVNTRDLWRSCANPNPTISPCSDNISQVERSRIAQLHPPFMKWFEKVIEESPKVSGYPLTRTGYTYDWNPKSSEFGVPEYLIRIGAKSVRYVRQVPTQKYCQR